MSESSDKPRKNKSDRSLLEEPLRDLAGFFENVLRYYDAHRDYCTPGTRKRQTRLASLRRKFVPFYDHWLGFLSKNSTQLTELGLPIDEFLNLFDKIAKLLTTRYSSTPIIKRVDLQRASAKIGEILVGVSSPKNSMTKGEKQVWKALNGRQLTGTQIVQYLKRNSNILTSEDLIRQHIFRIRQKGYVISHQRSCGYFRPDAPPP